MYSVGTTTAHSTVSDCSVLHLLTTLFLLSNLEGGLSIGLTLPLNMKCSICTHSPTGGC